VGRPPYSDSGEGFCRSFQETIPARLDDVLKQPKWIVDAIVHEAV